MITKNTICAVVVNDLGQVPPYTCQPTMQQTEEWAKANFPAWERMKGLGARVVQAELVIHEDA